MLDMSKQRVVRIVRIIGFFLLIIQGNKLLLFLITSYPRFSQSGDKAIVLFLTALFLNYSAVILRCILAVYLITFGRFIVEKSMSLIPKIQMENDDLVVWSTIRSIGLITLGFAVILILASLVGISYMTIFFHKSGLYSIKSILDIYVIQLVIISFYLLKGGKAIFNLIVR